MSLLLWHTVATLIFLWLTVVTLLPLWHCHNICPFMAHCCGISPFVWNNNHDTKISSQLRQLTLEKEGLEKERDFYFGKLRDIEVIAQENEDQPMMKGIMDILYATEVSLLLCLLSLLSLPMVSILEASIDCKITNTPHGPDNKYLQWNNKKWLQRKCFLCEHSFFLHQSVLLVLLHIGELGWGGGGSHCMITGSKFYCTILMAVVHQSSVCFQVIWLILATTVLASWHSVPRTCSLKITQRERLNMTALWQIIEKGFTASGWQWRFHWLCRTKMKVSLLVGWQWRFTGCRTTAKVYWL